MVMVGYRPIADTFKGEKITKYNRLLSGQLSEE